MLFCTYVCFLVFMRLCFYMNCQKVISLILINNTSFLKRLYNLFSFWIGDITYISDILYTCMYITFLNRWLSPFNSNGWNHLFNSNRRNIYHLLEGNIKPGPHGFYVLLISCLFVHDVFWFFIPLGGSQAGQGNYENIDQPVPSNNVETASSPLDKPHP